MNNKDRIVGLAIIDSERREKVSHTKRLRESEFKLFDIEGSRMGLPEKGKW